MLYINSYKCTSEIEIVSHDRRTFVKLKSSDGEDAKDFRQENSIKRSCKSSVIGTLRSGTSTSTTCPSKQKNSSSKTKRMNNFYFPEHC